MRDFERRRNGRTDGKIGRRNAVRSHHGGQGLLGSLDASESLNFHVSRMSTSSASTLISQTTTPCPCVTWSICLQQTTSSQPSLKSTPSDLLQSPINVTLLCYLPKPLHPELPPCFTECMLASPEQAFTRWEPLETMLATIHIRKSFFPSSFPAYMIQYAAAGKTPSS